jgi:hypothetical protein
MALESLLDFLSGNPAEGFDPACLAGADAGAMLAALQEAGIDPASLSDADLDVLLDACPELASDVLAVSADAASPAPPAEVRFGSDREWEYWGNGTYWERGPDGSYTGNSSGW